MTKHSNKLGNVDVDMVEIEHEQDVHVPPPSSLSPVSHVKEYDIKELIQQSDTVVDLMEGTGAKAIKKYSIGRIRGRRPKQ